MFDIYLFALAVAGAPEPAASAQPAIIDHVALEVADPTASADFYRRVLGLPPYAGKVPPGMRWMGDERFQLHLMGKHTKPVHTATDNHMAFRVSDIREEIRVLDRHNVKWRMRTAIPVRSRPGSTACCKSISRIPTAIGSRSTRRRNRERRN